MRRALLVSLSLAALGWMAGCGGSGMLGNGGGGGNTPDALNGQYAILLSGFDSNSNRLGIAGSIKADGLGHITGGELDVNDNGTSTPITSVSGTYGFDVNGASTLGTITLTNTLNGHPLAFGFSLQTSGNFGQIMTLDANNFISTGTMQLQTSSVFSLSSMAGDYIVTMNQRNAVNPTSVLGRFTLGSAGGTTNPSFDRSIANLGTAPATAASVTFASGGPDTNGRGTFTLSITDGLVAPATQNFAYYTVTANRIVAVETDSTGPMTADLSRQLNTPFAASTVVTTGGVFGLSGIDFAQANEAAAVGQLAITGIGSNTGALEWDANDSGNPVGPVIAPGQAVAFDPTTGRGTVTVANGFTHGLADTIVFYLSAPGTGFVLDGTAGTNNRAMAGNLMPQSGTSFSAAADFAGLGIVRTSGSSVSDEISIVGLFGPTSTPGDYALLFDERISNSGIQTALDQTLPNVNAPTPITLGAIDTLGRGTLQIPNVNAPSSNYAFYVIGPNQFRFIDINSADGASPVFYVSPQ